MDEATLQISWIDSNDRIVATASEDGCVRIYRYDHLDVSNFTWPMDKLLTRCTLPARCVAIEARPEAEINPEWASPRLAICSEEINVKIVSEDRPQEIEVLTGHSRGVRHAAWSPTKPILITCSCDGTARVWNMTRDKQPGKESPCTQVIKDIVSVTRISDTDRIAQAVWHPSGLFFVLPSKTNELVIMGRVSGTDQWQRKGTFGNYAEGIEPCSGAITAMAWSSNGKYFVSATAGNGHVTVWDTASRTAILRRESESNVTSIGWAPQRDSLAWADLGGQLYTWEHVVGVNRPQPFNAHSAITAGQQDTATTNGHSKKARMIEGDEARVEGDAPGRSFTMEQAFEDGEGHTDDDEGADDLDDNDALEDFLVDDEAGDYAREVQRLPHKQRSK